MRKPGCWTLVLIASGFCLLFTVAGALWWNSDADLRAADDYAASKGLPTAWKDLGLQPSACLPDWKRLMQLSEAVKSYVDGVDADDRTWNGPKPGVPVPATVRSYHQLLNQADLEEMLTLVDRLPEKALVEHVELDFTTLLPDISSTRSLERLLAERISLAAAADLEQECQRGILPILALEQGPLISHLVHCSLATIWCQAVANRLEEILPSQRAALTRNCLLLEQTIVDSYALVWSHEYLCLRQSLPRLSGRDLEEMALDGMSRMDGMKGLIMPAVIRLGRNSALTISADWVHFAGTHPVLLDQLTEIRKRADWLLQHRLHPRYMLATMMSPAGEWIISSQTRALLQLRLLRAEISRTDWPLDLLDPAGRQLQAIRRNGRVIGAYSVGKDGVDDGGHTYKDFCFPLYAPFGKTMAADPP